MCRRRCYGLAVPQCRGGLDQGRPFSCIPGVKGFKDLFELSEMPCFFHKLRSKHPVVFLGLVVSCREERFRFCPSEPTRTIDEAWR